MSDTKTDEQIEETITAELEADTELPPDEGAAETDGAPEGGESDDDDEPESAQPSEPDHAEPAGMTPEQFEKAAKASETSFKSYTKTVSRVWGDEAANLVECPLCPSQHKGFVNVQMAGAIPQEIQDAVRMYFGIAREQDYELDTDYQQCPKCKGKGQVALPTQVAGKTKRECGKCHGNGFLGPEVAASSNGHAVTGPTVLGHDLPPTQAFDDVDEWGEPRILPDGRENPNFGRMPNRKVLVEPWGVTANLNALSA